MDKGESPLNYEGRTGAGSPKTILEYPREILIHSSRNFTEGPELVAILGTVIAGLFLFTLQHGEEKNQLLDKLDTAS